MPRDALRWIASGGAPRRDIWRSVELPGFNPPAVEPEDRVATAELDSTSTQQSYELRRYLRALMP